MGPARAGAERPASAVRSRGALVIVAAAAAALMIHLFGPGLQHSAADSAEHGHAVGLATAAQDGAAPEWAAPEHHESACHAVVGVAPVISSPVAGCPAPAWHQVEPVAVSGAAMVGTPDEVHRGDRSPDPRRSPGVQRT